MSALLTFLAVPAWDFVVPPELEARVPPEARGRNRDGVRLLVSGDGRTAHAAFTALPDYLRAGDLLVANDSATLPAALHGTDADGASVEIHLSTQVAGSLWIAEPRAAPRDSAAFLPAAASMTYELPEGAHLTLLAPISPPNRRLWYAAFTAAGDPLAYLMRHGAPIRYAYADETLGLDAYQTIFARVPGSAEAPSAGRPFTRTTLAAAQRRGIGLATITLHCGVSSPEAHEPPAAERYAVPPSTARRIAETRMAGGRVIAVGTTVVRALESSLCEGVPVPSRGWTGLVVGPEHPPQVVDGLLTGFHEPRASHLQLISAFLGESALRDAYAQALTEGYLWHEFGDVHLILPNSGQSELKGTL